MFANGKLYVSYRNGQLVNANYGCIRFVYGFTTPLGGEITLILVVTFAASLGMSLPISTPPNALAHATGHVQSNQMARIGIILGVVGVLLSFVMVWLLHSIGHIG